MHFLLQRQQISGVSLRRCAKLLKVSYNTVVKHFYFLAEQAKAIHLEYLKGIQTSFVQVDEMETFMIARPCALSVPMVVRVKTGHILGFAIARMPAKGHLAEVGQIRYNWTKDERSVKFQSLIFNLKDCFKDEITFKSDSHTSYTKWIKNQIPHAKFQKVAGAKKKTPPGQDKPFDELFAINNMFARMRHDMNRLARKTWSTTKCEKGLEAHIWLYVAWNNGYLK